MNMTTGANQDDWHYRGVSIERDIDVDDWADLREVRAGEACVECGAELEIIRCIEAGHIFKLGRKYSEAMGISVLDADGKAQTPTMGSYGIGIGRAVAAIAENHHAERGLIWPMEVTPYHVVIALLDPDDESALAIANAVDQGLTDEGFDVLLDDRNARPGVKFADSELIGIPYRITIGSRGLGNGVVEFTSRSTGDTEEVNSEGCVDALLTLIGHNK